MKRRNVEGQVMFDINDRGGIEHVMLDGLKREDFDALRGPETRTGGSIKPYWRKTVRRGSPFIFACTDEPPHPRLTVCEAPFTGSVPA